MLKLYSVSESGDNVWDVDSPMNNESTHSTQTELYIEFHCVL